MQLRASVLSATQREAKAVEARNAVDEQLVPLRLTSERLEKERSQLKEHIRVLNQELDEAVLCSFLVLYGYRLLPWLCT